MKWPWKKQETPPEAEHLAAGKWGEKIAAEFLKENGYKILGKRVRVGKKDELDLVAKKEDVLVFVEVKTREDEAYGRPLDAVNKAKRKALSRAAVGYLQRLKKKPPFVRFDVVEVLGTREDKHPEIRHIENAFDIDSRYRLRW